MPLDITALPQVEIPRTITPDNRADLAAVGTPVIERRAFVLVRPESDVTWIETDTGDIAVRPGEAVAYDPQSKRAWRVTADDAVRFELAAAATEPAPSSSGPTPEPPEKGA